MRIRKTLTILVLIFVTNLPLTYFGWTEGYFWPDIILHFLGGFFVAVFFGEYLKENLTSQNRLKNLITVVGATILVGVLWEFAEYTAGQILSGPIYTKYGVHIYLMGDLADTMGDLLNDILGGLTASLIVLKIHRKS